MQDLLVQLIFYVFAAIAVLSAFMVITQNNPVRCVLFLVVTFFASAVLWILLNAEFLALILVLVYVGAVMTLFLFVVMMLNIDTESIRSHFIRYLPFGLILVALLVGLLLVAVPKELFNNPASQQAGYQPNIAQLENVSPTEDAALISKARSNTEALGLVLYTDYAYAFELAAVLLLVAIISAITLVHRALVRSKRQDVVKQMMTKREDRVRLVNLKPDN